MNAGSEKTARSRRRPIDTLLDLIRHSSRALRKNRLPILQGVLATAALTLVVELRLINPPSDSNTPLQILRKEGIFEWLIVSTLAVAAIALPWLQSAAIRNWHYLRRTWFAVPISAISAVVSWSAIAHFEQKEIAWVATGIFFLGITKIFWRVKENEEHPADSLQRTYFVNRLLEHIGKSAAAAQSHSQLRRIAILGSWGSGKTYVLKLLREKLISSEFPKFGVAMVNPWLARDAEEFRIKIAEAFDEALGYHHYFSTWLNQAWIKRLPQFRFGPSSASVSLDIERLFVGQSTANEEILINRVNLALKSVRRVCVILIDDMERADPDVVRKAFPLIDILGRIEYCYFIFALDPDQIADAFDETGRGGARTKGYLDKVFELQLELPACRGIDLGKMCAAQINPDQTPKLFSAWPILSTMLPSTPRQAIRFVNSAASSEVLFLSRYEDDEHDYVGYFFVRMMELEFPDIAKRMAERIASEFREIQSERHYKEFFNRDTHDIDKKIEELWSKVKGDGISGLEEVRAHSLWERIIISSVPIDWAFHLHQRLLTLDAGRRRKLESIWASNAGSVSIVQMIATVSDGERYSDIEEIAASLVQIERERYSDLRNSFVGAGIISRAEEILESATETLKRLVSHLMWAKQNSAKLDLSCFPEEFFDSWLETVFSQNLVRAKIPADSLISIEQRMSLLLSDRLSIFRAYQFVRSRTDVKVWSSSPREIRHDLEKHLKRVRSRLIIRLRSAFLIKIRSGDIGDRVFLDSIGVQSLFQLFGTPLFFGGQNRWPIEFDKLSREASANDQIYRSFAFITVAILKAVADVIRENDISLREDNEEYFNQNCMYFCAVWRMGLSSTSDHEDLLFRRAWTRELISNHSLPTQAMFDKAFPCDL